MFTYMTQTNLWAGSNSSEGAIAIYPDAEGSSTVTLTPGSALYYNLFSISGGEDIYRYNVGNYDYSTIDYGM
jgi:hypothetical protein